MLLIDGLGSGDVLSGVIWALVKAYARPRSTTPTFSDVAPKRAHVPA